MINKKNKILYEKLSGFFDEMSYLTNIERSEIITIFKQKLKEAKEEENETETLIVVLYKMAEYFLPYYCDILLSDLMVYLMENKQEDINE